MTKEEFIDFKNFLKSFKDGDFFQFHFDYGDEIENFSIFRVGKKMKYTSDRRTRYEDDYGEDYWVLDNDEDSKTLDMSMLKYIGSLETHNMRQGWREINCKVHF